MSIKDFKEGEYVVYPAHGVGKLIGYEQHEIGGAKLELMVISFEKEKMTLRLPESKAKNAGLRRLSTKDDMDEAFKVLSIRSKPKRTMWSRRAQEYETKINSGSPISIAEVIRDLHRRGSDSEQSYSERQIYQAALQRLARELVAIERIEEQVAIEKIEDVLKVA
jgi:CarD family transcriptional regulator